MAPEPFAWWQISNEGHFAIDDLALPKSIAVLSNQEELVLTPAKPGFMLRLLRVTVGRDFLGAPGSVLASGSSATRFPF